MKKTAIIAFLFIIFSYCNSQNGAVVITGKLSGPNNQWVYISEMSTNNLIQLDSVQLTEKGEFKFELAAIEPKFILLQVDKNNLNNVVLIASPNEKIEIKGNASRLSSTYEVNGSHDSRLIRDFNRKMNFTIQEKNKLAQTYRDSISSANREQILQEVQQKYNTLFLELKNYTYDFIDNNHNSMAALWVLYQQLGPQEPLMNAEDDYTYFARVDSGLSAMYPSNPSVQALNKHVTYIAESIKQKEHAEKALAIGTKAPEIALPNPDGDTIALSSLRGEYVLLDFWASWCKPCRMENPNLVKNYNSYNSKGFNIYQVSLDRTYDAWTEGIKKDQLTWVHVSDLKFWSSSVVPLYQVTGIPANYLLDKEGRIIAKNLRGPELGKKLAEILD